MNRRGFFKILGAAAVAEILGPPTVDVFQNTNLTEAEIQKSKQEIIDFLEKKYKIKINVLKGMTLRREKEILETLKREIIKYPPGMFQPKKYQFEFGIILENEALGPIVCSSTPYHRDTDGKVDYTLVRMQPQFQLLHQRLLGSGDKQIANAFHHELVHAFESKSDREYLAKLQRRWDELNTGGYSSWSELKGWLDAIGISSPPGFLNYRAQIEGEEDRAVTGSHIMRGASPQHIDNILEKKIEMMKEIYSIWSNGLMDEKYWNDLQAGRVNFGYWENS